MLRRRSTPAYGAPVALLTVDVELPAQPHRVLIAGGSGAGKTTVARSVAAALHLPVYELDCLFHGPGWRPRPSFQADVEVFSRGADWVTEWQYDVVRPLLAERADLVVWLDLPRWTVTRQVAGRTYRRLRNREVLWNGNVEPPLARLLTDPESVIRWAWRTQPESAKRVAALLTSQPALTVVRLRDRGEVTRWLAGPLARVAAR